jgi:hypothetical protein
MKVSIKEFDVEMSVKNNGIEIGVHDNDDAFLGDLYVTKKHIIWCNGKTARENGKKLKWKEFIDIMNQ